MDPVYLVFFLILLLITAVLVPKVLKGQSSEADSLLTTALLKKQNGSESEAEYYLQRALDAFQNEKAPDFGKMCACVVQLAECHTRSGKYEEARRLYAKLVELWSSAVGKDNPEVFLDIDYLASTANFGAGTNDVTECYARIIDAKRRVFGQNHPDVANSLKIYALLLNQLGRKDEAAAAQVEAETLLAHKDKSAD